MKYLLNFYQGLETYDRPGVTDSLEKRLKPILDGRIVAFPYVLEKVFLPPLSLLPFSLPLLPHPLSALCFPIISRLTLLFHWKSDLNSYQMGEIAAFPYRLENQLHPSPSPPPLLSFFLPLAFSIDFLFTLRTPPPPSYFSFSFLFLSLFFLFYFMD